MGVRLLGFAAALSLLASTAQAAPDVVKTDLGTLKGRIDGEIASFKGVPFAAPPVGALRWKAPQPAAAWTGERDAGALGFACPQAIPGLNTAPVSEDCLTLNVWAPKDFEGRKLPVMVWIHGGAFLGGSSAQAIYDGTKFAQKGVVLVSANHRLGRLGFFAHPALAAESPKGPIGNYALMDQIATLEWVQRNIAAFGGDPKNVTVFGESAGAISVNYLMTSPMAKGLFAKAIAQSGFGRIPAATLRGQGVRVAETQGQAFAQANGITGSGAEALAALRALPVATLMTPAPNGPWPMIDGVVVTEDVVPAFAAGHQAKVPYLAGGNSYEASLFRGVMQAPEPTLSAVPAMRDALIAAYGGPANLGQVAADITTDAQITEPNRHLARLHAKAGQPAWLYHFSYVPESQRATAPGAPHAAELIYVFGNMPKQDMPLLGGGTWPATTPSGQAISDAMQAYWVAFAKGSDPKSAGGPAWPRYSQSQDVVMEFGADGVHPRKGFKTERLDLIEVRDKALAGGS